MLSANALNFKNNLGDMWNILRTPELYWHTTTIERSEKIFFQGISPSNGTIESDYPNSLGAHFKAICLFDFWSPEENAALERECDWGCFLVGDAPLKIFIGIDKTKLKREFLIDQNGNHYKNRGILDQEVQYKNHIQEVECWYTEKIMPSEFKSVLLIKRIARPFFYELLPFDLTIVKVIQSNSRDWLIDEINHEAENLANGIISASTLLAERKNGKISR